MVNAKRAAVVGSGFGGIAAAIRLQASGIQTVLFEARDLPGGRAYVYKQEGFTFDAGPTVITAPQCIDELFTSSGREMKDYVELLPVHPFYRLIWENGTIINYDAVDGLMEKEVLRVSPGDIDGYQKFLEYSRKVYVAGYEKLAAEPFLRFTDMVRTAPALARLRADRSVYDTVSRFVKNEHLRQALSFHALLVGGNPFSTSAIYTLIHHLERKWGVFFPRGGTGALVQGLIRLFQDLGGEVRLSTAVQRIRVETRNGATVHKVETKENPNESFDMVVSNADLHHTYSRLYQQEESAKKQVRKLEKMDWSMSLFVLYFGTDRKYPDLAHHTVLFGPRYRELLDEVFGGSTLPEDFSLYLHAPTVTDPSLAPAGHEAFYVLAPVPHLGHAALDWNAIGPAYAQKVLTYLERVLPNLRQHVVTQRIFTPNDFQSELNAFHGSAFSVSPRLTQSAYFRPHNRDSHIPGLYIVGAGTHPGAGVPGVINSAKATVSTILSDYSEGRAA
ncbi:MAG: phytoene desaturase [Deltaproteobacteria bacterium]|nr:phytoene desaturase [Deltaproteobacteria bacterium]